MEQTDEHEDEEDSTSELEVCLGLHGGVHGRNAREQTLRLVFALGHQQQKTAD